MPQCRVARKPGPLPAPSRWLPRSPRNLDGELDTHIMTPATHILGPLVSRNSLRVKWLGCINKSASERGPVVLIWGFGGFHYCPEGQLQPSGNLQVRHHSFRGSFSAGSTPLFASKFAFCSIFQDLQEYHLLANKFANVCKISHNFVKI